MIGRRSDHHPALFGFGLLAGVETHLTWGVALVLAGAGGVDDRRSDAVRGQLRPIPAGRKPTTGTLSLGLAALAGAMLSYARGTGSYDGDAGAGTVESTLTGVFPFAGVDLSDRPVTASMVIVTLGLRLPRRYD